MPVQLHSHSGEEGDEARIEIIPLIDIMFFLLAAFMLVSLSMTHMRRVSVDLPESSASEQQQETPPVAIAIDAQGVVTWDREVVTASEITERLLGMKLPDDCLVMIAADEEARHRQVLAVMNAIRKAGLRNISFETNE